MTPSGLKTLESKQNRRNKTFRKNERNRILTLTKTAVWQHPEKAETAECVTTKSVCQTLGSGVLSLSRNSPCPTCGTESGSNLTEGNHLWLPWAIRMPGNNQDCPHWRACSYFLSTAEASYILINSNDEWGQISPNPGRMEGLRIRCYFI